MQSLKKFFRLYSQTRKRLGTTIGPFQLFKNTYKYAISKNNGIIVEATHQNKMIAAAVYLHFNKSVIFQHGASDAKYHHLRPNNLIMWEAIKWYAQKGFETFSLGITPLDHVGLRRYKMGMASSETMMNIYVYNIQKCKLIDPVKINPYKKGRKTQILKRTPIPILKLWGKYSYKHNECYYG
jgi:lipid II:glycine glycyltransferase (peptidoglycan interpeptide bridge formation enzyme)